MARSFFLTVIFILALLFIIITADQGVLPDFISTMYAFPYGDKVGHLILMGMLSLLVNLSLSCRTIYIASRNVLLGSMVVLILVTIEEFSQILFVSRNFSLLDICFSYLGIWAFGQLAIALKKKSSVKSV